MNPQIEEIVSEIRRITERLGGLDRRRAAFGATAHRYRFAEPLPEADVAAFERRSGIALPPSYRAFVTRIGNGGAGPYYGILPLDLEAQGVSRPFPYAGPTELPDDDSLDDALEGAIRLAEYGCGIEVFLVVKGKAAGQVWWDARYENGLSPMLDEEEQPLAFDRFWLRGMGRVLERFETIASLMSSRTAHGEIHTALDKRFLQLEVDETMASLMDREPTGTPARIPDKPWGLVCGQVDDLYRSWLERAR